ncbi:MAG: hypothetical protein ABIH23_01560, partial [bacterium]
MHDELILRPTQLPATVEELHTFILVGKERLNAQKAKIRAIEKVGMAHIAKAAALSDAQDVAEILLDAEVRLGEMLGGIKINPIPDSSQKGTFGGSAPSLPPGITKKESHQAQTLAKNPEIVELVKAQARERDEIPTAREVYREIKDVKKKEKKINEDILVQETISLNIADICDIRCCSMPELLSSGIKPDAVITDPPYPKEYLGLYGELAQSCSQIPLVAVMCGQSYFPEVVVAMTKYLKYRWIIAYLTPGGQAVQLWDRKINTFWKPVLLF